MLPGGRGNDFAAQARASRSTPVDGVRDPRARRRRTVDVGGGRRPDVPRHRELRHRHRGARTSRTPRPASRPGGLPVRDAARAGRVEGGAAASSPSTAAAARSTASPSPRQLRRLRRRHVPRAGRRARRRPARHRLVRRPAEGRFLRGLARVFRGTHLRDPAVDARARRARSASTPTAVHGLRRRRSGRRDCPATIRAVPRAAPRPGPMTLLGARLAAARGVGRCPRRAGAAARRCPARLLLRMEPHAIGELAARLRAAARSSRATNGKTTTAAMVARSSSAAARGWSTTAPARTWPAAWRPRSCARRAAGRPRASSRSTSSGSTASCPSSARARCCWPTSSATSSTATASSRRSPTAGPRSSPARRARRSCSTPTTRSSPTSAATATASLYFGVEDAGVALAGHGSTPSDSKHCRRCGAPYVYDAVYLGHLGRYHCPNCGATPARARGRGDARSCSTACAARDVTLRTPQGDGRRRAPAARPLQRLQRARRRGARADARRARWRTSWPAWRRSRRRSGARRRVRARRPRADAPARQEPGGRQRGPADAGAGTGEHDLLGVLNDHTADGRDVSWVWDADFEVLAGACAA